MHKANANMKITVRYLTVLRRITEKKQESVEIPEGSTVADVLVLLINRYGKSLEKYVSSGEEKGLKSVYLLNGQDVSQFNGLKTQLQNGDTIAMMPPIAGG